ncbi:exodeoxyribonuclease III [Candidatus Saccharibacteria bacterium]|nr:exodeoxyribonuclease III [Candidatus Saccharibacteria bacterium]
MSASLTSLRLFSWNVNGLRAVLKKHALQDFLAQHSPDVLCLQEIKCRPDQLAPLELHELEQSYQIFWHPAQRPGYSGTAILIRKAITKHSLFSEYKESKIAKQINMFCNLSIAEGRVQILDCGRFFLINVYTPNSKPDLSRLPLRQTTWDPAFLHLLKSLETKKPVITCGDFNAAHTDLDLARPKQNQHNAGFTPEERLGIDNLLSAGFLDTFRLLNPDAKRYTWWSHWGQARANNVGWRIDYFFTSASLKPLIKSANIHESVLGSDHCPVSLELALPA